MSKEIPLTQGAVTIVDDTDYDWLNQWSWYLSTGGYAQRSVYTGSGYTTIFMHRVILKASAGVEVDHTSRDCLDNRRVNLRLCTGAQSSMNRAKTERKCSSKYKGVSWDRYRWAAYIYKEYVKRHLGRFKCEEDAARAYNEAAKELFGEFAVLNEVPQ